MVIDYNNDDIDIVWWYYCVLIIDITLEVVRPEVGASAKQGDAIVSNTIIRLQHMTTRKWLHSHTFESPLSGNQEVGLSLHCDLVSISLSLLVFNGVLFKSMQYFMVNIDFVKHLINCICHSSYIAILVEFLVLVVGLFFWPLR